MEIFEASPFDLEQLSSLLDEYRKFYEQESDIAAAQRFLAERMKNKDSVIFVAAYEGELTGFVQLYPLFSSVQMKRLWLLNDLFVRADYRKKGIGEALIKQAKEYAIQTAACGIMLETSVTNVEGNNLYIKEKFHLIGNNFYYWSI